MKVSDFFLMTLTALQTIHMCFRIALKWDLSDVFLIRLEWWVSEMKITDVNCYLYYIISKTHTINMTSLLIWPSITLLREYVKFLTVKLLFPTPLFSHSFEGSHCGKPTLKKLKSYTPSPWGQKIYINYLEFFCVNNLSSYVYLSNHLSIIVWTHGYLLYTLVII